jgi:hypothetical protein
MPGQSLPRDRAIEHPADPDTVEIGWSDSEADGGEHSAQPDEDQPIDVPEQHPRPSLAAQYDHLLTAEQCFRPRAALLTQFGSRDEQQLDQKVDHRRSSITTRGLHPNFLPFISRDRRLVTCPERPLHLKRWSRPFVIEELRRRRLRTSRQAARARSRCYCAINHHRLSADELRIVAGEE